MVVNLYIAKDNVYFTSKALMGRRTWQLLPGESHGQRSLVGCHLWGPTESDTTETT